MELSHVVPCLLTRPAPRQLAHLLNCSRNGSAAVEQVSNLIVPRTVEMVEAVERSKGGASVRKHSTRLRFSAGHTVATRINCRLTSDN